MDRARSVHPDRRTGAQSVERALGRARRPRDGDGDLGITDIAGDRPHREHGPPPPPRARRRRARAQDPLTERYQLGSALVVLGRRAEPRLGYDRMLPGARVARRAHRGVGQPRHSRRRRGAHRAPRRVEPAAALRPARAAGSRSTPRRWARRCSRRRRPAGRGRRARRSCADHRATLTTTGTLLRDVEAASRRGWAINDGERNPGVRTIGAAVPRPTGAARRRRRSGPRRPDGRRPPRRPRPRARLNGRRRLLPRLSRVFGAGMPAPAPGGTKHSGGRASGGVGGDQGADAVGLFGANVGVEDAGRPDLGQQCRGDLLGHTDRRSS